MDKELADQADEYAKNAAKFFKLAEEVRESANEGQINRNSAIEMVTYLYNQAIAETEKAIKLQKEFIEMQNKK